MQIMQDNIEKTLQSIKSEVSDVTFLKPHYLENGKVIIPINKVSTVFISSDSDIVSKNVSPEISIGGGGVNVTPLGFIVYDENKDVNLKLIEGVKEDSKWMDFIISTINLIKKK